MAVQMRSVLPMRVSSHGIIACVRQEILSVISIMFRIGGAKMDARLSTFSTLGRPYFVHVGHPACASSATCYGWPLAQYHLCRRCVGASSIVVDFSPGVEFEIVQISCDQPGWYCCDARIDELINDALLIVQSSNSTHCIRCES